MKKLFEAFENMITSQKIGEILLGLLEWKQTLASQGEVYALGSAAFN